jgi:hypothetical protein
MNFWHVLLRGPARLNDRLAGTWFEQIADQLLNRTRLVAGGLPHRLVEIEFYYRGPGHEDPFTHADPIQAHPGRWYFHRTGGVYRGGSFKGLDVTFGGGDARGGILIRGMESPDGRLIDGPSVLVDELLRRTGVASVRDLDHAIAGRLAHDPTCPLQLVEAADPTKKMLACARVGLSLRRAEPGSTRPHFLTRPYRYLTEPVRTAKGKVHMVLALHRSGMPADEIRKATACPRPAIDRYVAEYKAGRRAGRFEDYFGKELGPKDIARLHGIADRMVESAREE